MVPSSVVRLPALPMTLNGKIDFVALPDKVETPCPQDGTDHERETFEVLATIWAHVLPQAAVSPDANFFAAGGDSLGAARAAALAQDQGIQIEATDLFEAPVLRDLVALVAARGPRNAAPGPDESAPDTCRQV